VGCIGLDDARRELKKSRRNDEEFVKRDPTIRGNVKD